MKTFALFLLITFCFASCSVSVGDRNTNSAANDKATSGGAVNTAEQSREVDSLTGSGGASKKPAGGSASKSQCLNVKTGDKIVLAKQTFPIDFEPFRQSCFVTAHDPEYDDPPLDSEFSIYTDGKEVFKFPEQFNGTSSGCWVEGVAFQDLNADGLTDVIVAGMCGAKSGPYSENMVYANTGRGFTTDPIANSKLQDLKRIKDIADFVKSNQKAFFK
jgi:hypothetical protein